MMFKFGLTEWAVLGSCLAFFFAVTTTQQDEVRNIGSRLELFVDDWLIAKINGVTLRLH